MDLDNKDRDSPGSMLAAQSVSVIMSSCHHVIMHTYTYCHLSSYNQVSYLEYDPTIPSKFMLGTDSGQILCCSRKARAQPDVVKAIFRLLICFSNLMMDVVEYYFLCHSGDTMAR